MSRCPNWLGDNLQNCEYEGSSPFRDSKFKGPAKNGYKE